MESYRIPRFRSLSPEWDETTIVAQIDMQNVFSYFYGYFQVLAPAEKLVAAFFQEVVQYSDDNNSAVCFPLLPDVSLFPGQEKRLNAVRHHDR